MSTKRNLVEAIYPLSPMQQGMLFHTLYDQESGVYLTQINLTLRGNLDVPSFQRAWELVIERHPVLRTAFVWERRDEPFQVVYRQVRLPWAQHDLRERSPSEQEAEIAAFLDDDLRQGFALDKAPLMRLVLFQTADDTHQFVWSQHHLLMDGWSLPLVIGEVFQSYEAFAHGRDIRLPAARPYREYIAWLQKQDMQQAEAFWRQNLAGFTAPTPLGVDLPLTSDTGTVEHVELEVQVPSDLSAQLQTLTRQHGLTLNTVVQGAWALLLSRYSGEHDVVFGATVSGRPADLPGVERMIGLFINTLPVRVQLDPRATLLDWLKQIQAQQADLRQYEYSPLVQVQGWSEIPRGQSLFESLVVFENYPTATSQSQPGNRRSLEISSQRSLERGNYPLNLTATTADGLGLRITYDRRRFTAETIERLIGHLQTILAAIAAAPGQRLSQISLLAETERQLLLHAWTATTQPFPQDRTVHELIAEQAAQQPEAVAVVWGAESLSYAALNARANQLAHVLQEAGVGPDRRVGLCLQRSLDLVVALLAILKAGGAYVPLDPSYPQDLLRFMLADADVSALLTVESLRATLPPINAPVLCLDRDAARINAASTANPVRVVTPDQLAYVIYTSGSTGQPKGVAVAQRGLVNLAQAQRAGFAVAATSRLLQFASISFDASVSEVVVALTAGAVLELLPSPTPLVGAELARFLAEHRITHVTLPPSVLATLPEHAYPDLATLVVAGEACSVELMQRWAGGRRFVNAYGPTETTVCATLGVCDADEDAITIGQALANTQAYVLDAQMQPVPIGVVGELYVAGVGLARGYLNRPDLTAERFVPHPFSDKPGARLYRTGDHVRYTADGQLVFVGRADTQLKLRGYRIEPEQIAAHLRQHPAVADALVLARHDGDETRLVAYVVGNKETKEQANKDGETAAPPSPIAMGEGGRGDEGLFPSLRAFLRERLPEYMLPSAFVALAAWPLTPNGKIDRNALPAPEAPLTDAQRYTAPQSPTEDLLAGIWAEVLKIERISVHDSFFDLGGHSLLATQVISRVRTAFQIDVPLRSLFDAPTVAGFAARIEALRDETVETVPPMEPVHRDQPLPLSYAQQRLWFLDQLEPGSSAYAMPIALRLRGGLDLPALQQSLDALVQRHESLRTTFAHGDAPVQVIHPTQPLPIALIDLSQHPADARAAVLRQQLTAAVAQPFDLQTGPLLRATLFQLDTDEHALLLNMHHIIADGWSMQVLLRELVQLYRAAVTGTQAALPELPIQYADYAVWQRQWLQGEILASQIAYWRQQLAAIEPLQLPTDYPRPAVATLRGAVQEFALPKALGESLTALSRREGATLFMTLLAAWQLLLSRYSGQDDIVVGTPIANRTRGETEGVIGFFVNTLVLRTAVAETLSFRELMARVREVALGAYAHQDLPFEQVVEQVQPARDLSRHPLFQVMFAVQTALGEAPEFSNITSEPLLTGHNVSKFDLSLTLNQTSEGLHGILEYSTDLFAAATIERLVAHFELLLQGIVADPKQHIADLPLLTTAEQESLAQWNATAEPYARERLVHELLAQQAARTPEATALTCGAEQLRYAELDDRANQLAQYLQTLRVGSETRVALYLERSLELVVALLAVWKAGGAYVPIDPSYPVERVAFILTDAQPVVVLTQESLRPSLPETMAQVVDLDTDAAVIAAQPVTPPVSNVGLTNLAYLIYTSGTTGTPKAVAVEHGQLLQVLHASQTTFGYRATDVQPWLASVAFDIAAFELVNPLLVGGTVVIQTQAQILDLPQLVHDLHGWTLLHAVPSLLRQIVEQAKHVTTPDAYAGLRRIWVGGDAVPPELLADTLAVFAQAELVVLYGPTEGTIICASHVVDPRQLPTRQLIGRPLPNAQLRLYDAHRQLVPLGVAGELYLGGGSVTRGYLNRPELTAEKFMTIDGQRWYRTGDRARYLPDGTLEFLGRTDSQVKIRGYRIEVGEVEAVLAQHPIVREAVVMARADGGSELRLVAYIVEEQENTGTNEQGTEPLPSPVATGKGPGVRASSAGLISSLRQFLGARLPAYMLPSAFVVLDALPLSANGKVDRKALPAPDASAMEADAEVAQTPTEELLAGIWAAVLGRERVGVTTNFFALGGHSLLATQVVSRIRAVWGQELPLRQLFETPTVADLARVLDQRQHAPDAVTLPALRSVDREQALPLSYAQQRLWFLDQLEPGSSAYAMPIALRLRGGLDVAALQQSLDALVQRHESLRTTFAHGDAPVQVIHGAQPLPLTLIDLSQHPADARAVVLRQHLTAAVAQPFELQTGPLLRAMLFQLDTDEHALLLNMHHIIADGWSMGVLVRELIALYTAVSNGQPPALPELPIQYADYAVWQRQWLQGAVLESQLAYWRQQLAALEPLQLPTDYPRPAVATLRGAVQEFALPKALGESLTALSRREGATLFMTLLAAWQVLLSRYSGQDDIVVGTPIANRTRGETEGVIGFFVNTLVLRTDLQGAISFRDVLMRVREVALGAYAHQDLPFEQVVEQVQPARDLSRHPLFQVMFAVHSGARSTAQAGDLTITPVEVPVETTKFDLSITFAETDTGLQGFLEYSRDLFAPETIGRLLTHFTGVLGALVADLDAPVATLPVLTASEQAQLDGWNATAEPYARERLVHELLAQQAARTPEATALVYGAEQLRYAELDDRANQLAHCLQTLGVGPETRVALYLERSLELVVALLAVWKAGGAYVPIDPSYPAERVAFILGDAQPVVVLTQESLAATLPETTAQVVQLDADAATIAAHPVTPPVRGVGLTHLAYLIYTSGTTGTPKAVAVEHGQLLQVLHASQTTFGYRATDVQPWLASVAFDIAAFELVNPLLVGGTVVIETQAQILDLPQLVHDLQGWTLLHAVPSLLRQIVEQAKHVTTPDAYAGLRRIWVGGDAVPPELLADTLAVFAQAEVVVLYGPTEGTIICASHVVDPQQLPTRQLIGRPLPNAQLRLYDAHGQLVPLGVAGELYIGGGSVTRGYLNRPELTAEKFVTIDGARWYRTGDRARYLPDGTLEFLGRTDHQVKIRGYRIEVGEVEAALAQHPAVREAVVLARADGGSELRLVAYLVPAPNATPTTEELRQFLDARLPAYMLPSAFVVLDALPLSANGKVDRKALPAPDASAMEADAEVAQTPTEELLAGIWAEVLQREHVGVTTNFFALGGHSLLATQVVSRIRAVWGQELPLRQLFETPTVADLARVLDQRQHVADAVAPPALRSVDREQALPLSYAQQRLWFLDQLEPGSSAYAMPIALRLQGGLDLPALQQSLDALVQRHESLRTTFPTELGQPAQVIAQAQALLLRYVDLETDADGDREAAMLRGLAEDAGQPFDLQTGPLLRTTLFRLDATEHVLLLNMHHIIADGWSMQVLLRELVQLYRAAVTGIPAMLPELPIQYADYAVWQRQWLQGHALDAQLGYWKQQLAAIEPLQLPTDYPRPAMPSFQGATYHFALPADVSAAVVGVSRREGATLFMTLLAAWQVLLSRYSGQDDIVVGTPIANRTRGETEGVIGFFVNTLVLRTDLQGAISFRDVLMRVREVALGAYAHQDLPFEQIVDAVEPTRDLSRHPLFQVMFAVHSASQATAQAGDLTVTPVEVSTNTTKFDLSITFAETAVGLEGVLEYSTDLFAPETIGRLLTHFTGVLGALVADLDAPVATLPVLTASEQAQLDGWNATTQPYARERLAHELVAQQAARTPEATALVYGAEQLSYAELDDRANQLAQYLQTLGVGPETRVALYLERSLELVVALLAVWKAGGAYVPIDPSYPAERVAFILGDAQPVVVLTQDALRASLPKTTAQVVQLDADVAAIAAQPVTPPVRGVGLTNLAYLIYTSGTTGTPKAVAVEHGQLLQVLHASQTTFGYRATDVQPWLASVAFDIAAFELVNPLLAGGTVVIETQAQILDLPQLVHDLHGWTLLHAVPSLLRQIVEQARQVPTPNAFAGVRRIWVGGDAVPPELLADTLAVFAQAEVVVLYGPTEGTIICASHVVDPQQLPTRQLIGRPLPNAQLRLYDAHGQLVPLGVAGELYLGGGSVTRGYLNRPELTAEKFVTIDGQRWYRSGDRARYLPDGTLEFLGRTDHQVKIRGYRIEVGEVEAALAQHPAVREAVVLARADNGSDLRLVAYIVEEQENLEPRTQNLEPSSTADSPSPVPQATEAEARRGSGQGDARRAGGEGLVPSIRQFLGARLPAYMVPSAFVVLDALPLSANGKVDRKALPAPDQSNVAHAASYVAPQNEVEEKLAQIWAEVLRLERVGIHDNFFSLGGDSILSIQVIARANQAGLRLTPKQIFQHQTIAELAAVADTTPVVVAEQGLVTGAVPLTPIQQHFFAQDVSTPQHFNQAQLLEAGERLDPAVLEQALQQLLLHHDALRLRFQQAESGWTQEHAAEAHIALATVDISALPEVEHELAIGRASTEIQASLNLQTGPIMRAALFERGPDQPQRLLLVVHHLAVDAVSWSILLEDLQTAYTQLRQETAITLPPKTTAFKQWAERLRTYAASSELLAELPFWLSTARRAVPALPVDQLSGANTLASSTMVTVRLSAEETHALLHEVADAYQTQITEVLLTALALTINEWTGDTALRVDLEGHGREDLFEEIDLSRTVGWFTALYPLLLTVDPAADPGSAIKAIKEQVRQVPQRGIGYGVLRYLNDAEETAPLRAMPAAEVIFNYLGQLDRGAPTAGLLKPARGSSGLSQSADSPRDHLLEITGSVYEGMLQLSWVYSQAIHQRATIERVAYDFIATLQDLIAHCLAPDAGGFTPSDFPLAQLDQDTLDKLASLLDDVDTSEELPV